MRTPIALVWLCLAVACSSSTTPPPASADTATAADTGDTGGSSDSSIGGGADTQTGSDAQDTASADQSAPADAAPDVVPDAAPADAAQDVVADVPAVTDSTAAGDTATSIDSGTATDADATTTIDACVANCQPDCSDGCGGTCEGKKCDDGVACTVNDFCKAGKCVPEVITCPCATDADCGKNSPPPPCGPVSWCDKSTPNWACKVKTPGLTCPDSPDSCATGYCDAAAGACKLKNKTDMIVCDDGDACTVGDFCEGGKCVASAFTCQCKTTADCAKSEDGDACNGTLVCNVAAGKCEVDPKTVVKCDTGSDTTCLKTLCNKKTAKCEPVFAELIGKSCPPNDLNCSAYVLIPPDKQPLTVACDDGDACTGSSACAQGKCVTDPTALLCGCKSDTDCAKYGHPCTGPLVCDTTKGFCAVDAKVAIKCDATSDKPCLKNTCVPTLGKCLMLPPSCADGNQCTADTCDPASGCKFAAMPDGAACLDGKGACAAGKCVAKP